MPVRSAHKLILVRMSLPPRIPAEISSGRFALGVLGTWLLSMEKKVFRFRPILILRRTDFGQTDRVVPKEKLRKLVSEKHEMSFPSRPMRPHKD